MPPPPCPPQHDLLRYDRGDLPEVLADKVTAHLASCPHCRQLLIDAPVPDELAEVFARARRLDTSRRLASPYPTIPGCVILERVGAGGMGVVYAARQLRPDRRVAVKVLGPRLPPTPAAAALLLREADILAALDHPNIVPVYAAGEAGGRPYIIMQFVRGTSLAEYPRGTAGEEAARLATVARAVHHAHQQRLVHRDLKPGNVLVDERGEPFVSDFGLGGWFGASGDLTDGPLQGAVGTPSYMSPEQAAGEDVGPASDVYSLGLVLYERLTARLAFDHSGLTAARRANRERTALPPRAVNPRTPRDLEAVCLKCLEVDPERRYRSAAALADDLDRFRRRLPVRARRYSLPHRVVRYAAAYPVATVVAVVVVALLSAAVGMWFWNSHLESAAAARRQADAADDLRRRYEGRLLRAEVLWEHAPEAALTELADGTDCPPGVRDHRWTRLHRLATRDALYRPQGVPASGVVIGDQSRSVFSPDGRAVARGKYDDGDSRHYGGHRLWVNVFGESDGERVLRVGERRSHFPGHDGPNKVHGWAFSPDGRHLAVLADWVPTRPQLEVWDLTRRTVVRTHLVRSFRELDHVVWAAADRLVYSFTQRVAQKPIEELLLVCVDPTTGAELFAARQDEVQVMAVGAAGDGSTLATVEGIPSQSAAGGRRYVLRVRSLTDGVVRQEERIERAFTIDDSRG